MKMKWLSYPKIRCDDLAISGIFCLFLYEKNGFLILLSISHFFFSSSLSLLLLLCSIAMAFLSTTTTHFSTTTTTPTTLTLPVKIRVRYFQIKIRVIRGREVMIREKEIHMLRTTRAIGFCFDFAYIRRIIAAKSMIPFVPFL